MKKLCGTIMLLLFLGLVFGQTPSLTNEDYLEKSKNQKAAGIAVLIAGTSMMIAGIITANKTAVDLGSTIGNDIDKKTLLYGGFPVDLISIPFFVSSGKNEHKAATLSFNHQHLSIPQNNSYGFALQPTLTVRIPLN